MRIKKNYEEHKVSRCPFCNGPAITRNSQKIPVCTKHKNDELVDLRCKCGSFLDVKIGKFGPFFICVNCNIVKFKVGLEINGYPLKSVNDL